MTMTPPKATPDRKGKVCKPIFRLIPKSEMKEINKHSPIELDEIFGLIINKIPSDERKTTQED